MRLGIDPKVDYAFKFVYGREPNLHILKSFLEAVLARTPFACLSELRIVNPFNEHETTHDKLSVVDIRAREASGRLFQVEMQLYGHEFLPRRVLYYWAKPYAAMLRKGQSYEHLHPVVSICLVNDVIAPDLKGYHSRFVLVEPGGSKPFCEDLEIHLLQLPRFQKKEVHEPLDQWLYFLQNASQFDPRRLPKFLTLPPVINAVEELAMLSKTEKQRQRYEDRLKAERDAIWIRNSTISKISKGRAEGRAEGIIIGEIMVYQRLLKQSKYSQEDLEAKSERELLRIHERMKRAVED